MNLFSPTDLRGLTEPHTTDPAYDLARHQTRNQLAWLHERLYGEIRARRWDVHFRPEWSLSPAQISQAAPRIDALTLRYTKPEYVARLQQKQFGGPVPTFQELPWLAVGIDGRGVFVEWNIPARAQLDAQNFFNKLVAGAPDKRTLRQILAELSGEGVVTLRVQDQDILRVRCARLVDLNVLNRTLETFQPGQHAWNIAIRLAVTDERLATASAPDELLYRLAQLYAVHQFAVWSPRNNFLERTHDESNSGAVP